MAKTRARQCVPAVHQRNTVLNTFSLNPVRKGSTRLARQEECFCEQWDHYRNNQARQGRDACRHRHANPSFNRNTLNPPAPGTLCTLPTQHTHSDGRSRLSRFTPTSTSPPALPTPLINPHRPNPQSKPCQNTRGPSEATSAVEKQGSFHRTIAGFVAAAALIAARL